jgi:ankyrin repeat protein
MDGIINQLTNTPTEPALKVISRLSPLVVAITKLDYEAADSLLKAGAQVNAVNRDGHSTLMLLGDVHAPCVTPDSLLSLIQLLLSYGADTNLKILDEITSIGVAINSELMPCIRALIRVVANLSVEGRNLSLIARLIYRFRYIDGLDNTHALLGQDLVEIPRNFDTIDSLRAHRSDKCNDSLLHYAAYAGYTECVALLLNASLNVDQIRKRRSKSFAFK